MSGFLQNTVSPEEKETEIFSYVSWIVAERKESGFSLHHTLFPLWILLRADVPIAVVLLHVFLKLFVAAHITHEHLFYRQLDSVPKKRSRLYVSAEADAVTCPGFVTPEIYSPSRILDAWCSFSLQSFKKGAVPASRPHSHPYSQALLGRDGGRGIHDDDNEDNNNDVTVTQVNRSASQRAA